MGAASYVDLNMLRLLNSLPLMVNVILGSVGELVSTYLRNVFNRHAIQSLPTFVFKPDVKVHRPLVC